MGEYILSDMYFDCKSIHYKVILQPSLLDLKVIFNYKRNLHTLL